MSTPPSLVRWYPVADAPPPKDVKILVWASGHEVTTAALASNSGNKFPKPAWKEGGPFGRTAFFTPTHWSPMPEPPLDIT
jgi:hypothetical protein